MDPNRWQRIEEVFNATLALSPEDRESFLTTACGDDEDLRGEITALIGEVSEADPFLSEGNFALGTQLLSQVDAELLTGKILGSYTILRRIGRGGMGEVYLARDERLQRKVALKILPTLLVEHQERIRRFKHEARAASAISHPNVAHVYEIGDFDGTLFTAMEFVDGLTLRDRLARTDLKLGEAIDIAIQVASAIAAAHAQGIVHRDIKPENIMIRRDGLVKVVDFGIAKLSEPARALTSNLRDTRTGGRLTGAIHTEPGLLLGTAIYMSPEQARGQEIDSRTDIWSLGVVIYEMLTAETPFQGATNSDVIAEILKSEPRLLSGPFHRAPDSLVTIVRRALNKSREARYAEVSEMVVALREVQRELSEKDLFELRLPLARAADEDESDVRARGADEVGAPSPRPLVRSTITGVLAVPGTTTNGKLTPRESSGLISSKFRKPLLVALLLVGMAASIGLIILGKTGLGFRKSANSQRAPLQIVHVTNDGRVMDAAISSDGKLLAYVPIEAGKHSLRVRDLASSEDWQILPPDPALCWGLRFTPNGQSLFYVSTQPGSTVSVLYRLPVRGGSSQKMVVNIDSPLGLSPDGMQIAFVRSYPAQHRDALVVANIDGSLERELMSRQHPDKFSFSGVSWSPDNKLIAVGASRKNETEMGVLGIPLDGSNAVELTPWQWVAVRGVCWENDGHTLLFSAAAAGNSAIQIWRVNYPDGKLQPVTSDDKEYEDITLGPNVLVATDVYEVADLWSVDLSQTARRLTSTGHAGSDGMRVTSAGRLVYTEGENEQSHLWTMSLDGGDQKLLTKNSGFLPSPSSNGQSIAYVSTEGGGHHIWLVGVDGENNRQLTFGDGESYPSMTPDGQAVVYTSRAKDRGTLWRVRTAGGQPVQLTYAGLTLRPVVSPDGSMIACTYRADEADRWKIAILHADGGEPIRTFALPYPYNQIIRWTPDGQALTYLNKVNGVHNLWSQPIDGSSPTQITSFTEDWIMQYDWLGSAKGLVLSRGGRRRDIVLIRNFD